MQREGTKVSSLAKTRFFLNSQNDCEKADVRDRARDLSTCFIHVKTFTITNLFMPVMPISVGKDSAEKESAALSPSELRALVALLDDPDPFVQQKVAERLNVLEESMVPVLDQIRDELSDTALRHKVTKVLHKLTLPSLEVELAERVSMGLHSTADLEAVQLMLGRYENPTMRTDLYRRQLDRMAERASHAMHSGCCKAEPWRLFVHHFFEEEYFKGDRKSVV